MTQRKRSGGIPFKSKLRPHVDEIRKWRRAGFTWAAIAEKLEERGCKTYPTKLCQFMRRYRRRPFPSEAGPEVPEASPVTPRPRRGNASVPAKPSSVPDFEKLVDDAEESVRLIETRPIFNPVRAKRPL
ncbi:MAG: hypothetical protein WAK31_07220 [Chthoniobacterales bacterium]